MTKRISRKTYPMPASVRAKAALKNSWHVIAVNVFVWLVALVLALDGLEFKNAIGAFAAIATFFGLPAVFWLHWSYSVCPKVSYKIGGMKVMFSGEDYYVPKEVMERFVLTSLEPFGRYLHATGKNERVLDYLDGVVVMVENEVLRHHGQQVWGKTEPRARQTQIYGPFVTDPDGLGYELKLHICHSLFPGRHEADDIAWMKAHQIV